MNFTKRKSPRISNTTDLTAHRSLIFWLQAAFRMARPLQLVAVTLVYLLGVIIALTKGSVLNVPHILWGYGMLMLVSASVHTANEYSDIDTDRLTARTMFSGGSGALPESGLPRQGALVIAWIWLVASFLMAAAVYGSGEVETVPLVILAGGALLGWMYSLPPLQFAWRGWGELLNAFLGGILLPLYGAAVVGGRLDTDVIVMMLPFALLTFNNLLATTYADRRADEMVGKRTLATRFSDVSLRLLYAFILLLGVSTLLLTPLELVPLQVKRFSMVAFPIAIWGWWDYTRRNNPLPSVAAMVVMLISQLLGWVLYFQTPLFA